MLPVSNNFLARGTKKEMRASASFCEQKEAKKL
jgi:hypothetical protein